MKKMIFRLETVLKLRLAKEGFIKRELEAAVAKACQISEKEKTLAQQILTLMEEIKEKRHLKQWQLQDTYSQILEHLQESHLQLKSSMEAQALQIQQYKERLSAAIQSRKVIEKIKEKHYAQIQTTLSKEEGALIEDSSLKSRIK